MLNYVKSRGLKIGLILIVKRACQRLAALDHVGIIL